MTSTTASLAESRGLVPKTDFAEAYSELADERMGVESEGLQKARAQAMQRFQAHGLPSRKGELWRYLNLANFARTEFALGRSGSASADYAEVVAEHRLTESDATLVFVNGVWNADASVLPRELEGMVQPLSHGDGFGTDLLHEALGKWEGSQERPFLDLNTALFVDGAALAIGAAKELAGPVHLLFLHDAQAGSQASFPRILVKLVQGARATLVEEHISVGSGAGFSAPVTEVWVEDGAALEHVRVQDLGSELSQFASVDVALGKDAKWRGVSLQVGANTAREELRLRTAGSGGTCEFYSLALADAKRMVDIQADVVHASPQCSSRQTYRGIVDGKARAVFNSRVAVERGASGTDSGQSAKSLLLSDDAIADTKPQLEVLNDDVKCFHGATTGQLDEDALFFLRSRGIDKTRARALLTLAFAGEVVDAIPVDSLRERLRTTLETRLSTVIHLEA